MLNESDFQEIILQSRAVPIMLNGGNSSIKQVVYKNEPYAVKNYSARSDGAKRLSREFIATQFCHSNLPHLFARPLAVDELDQIAIFSWIDGIRPKLDYLTINLMLDILHELHFLFNSKEQVQIPNAVESISGFMDLTRQIENRLEHFRNSASRTSEIVIDRVVKVRYIYEDPFEVGNPVNTFSPSDFGAHNLLWDEKTHQVKCVDLEFFGVDDAHKLVCDSLLHPVSVWNDLHARFFLNAAISLYELDTNRLAAMIQLLAVRWSLIVFSRAERLESVGDVRRSAACVNTAIGYLDLACVKAESFEDIVRKANFGQLEH